MSSDTSLAGRTLQQRRSSWQLILLAALFVAAVAPTLSWPQFSGDSEDLVARTVLEMRHGGPWWVPTLGGFARIRKPPLPTWLSAAAVSPKTVADLTSRQPQVREAAYGDLAFQMRFPALLAAGLMLIAVGRLGGLMGGAMQAALSLMICATMLLFLRYVRSATTDVHLAVWVSVANLCLAHAVLRRRWWSGCLAGGVAIGLAIMCKGPVVLLLTILPFALFLICRRQRTPLAPVVVGIAVMLAVGLPWYIGAALLNPQSVRVWVQEVTAEGANRVSHDPWYAYLSLLPNLLPWLPLIIAGVCLACMPRAREFRRLNLSGIFGWRGSLLFFLVAVRLLFRRRSSLLLLLVFAPLLVMSFFPDRKDRYLLPMTGPLAILASQAAVEMLHAPRSRSLARKNRAKLVALLQWVVLVVMAIGLPLAGALALRQPNKQPWYSPTLAIGVALASLVILILAILRQTLRRQRRDDPLALVVGGAIVMLLLNALFLWGWSHDESGLSEMKGIADVIYSQCPPGKVIYYDPPPGYKPVTLDLDIYLDQDIKVLDHVPQGVERTGIVAMVCRSLSDHPDPKPALAPKYPGWRLLSSMPRRKHLWYVFVPDVPR